MNRPPDPARSHPDGPTPAATARGGLTPTAMRLARRLADLDTRQLDTVTNQQLARRLADLDTRQLDTVTNQQLATSLGVSTRSVTTALSRLVAAGRLTIRSRRGHPLSDPTGRSLQLTRPEAGERP